MNKGNSDTVILSTIEIKQLNILDKWTQNMHMKKDEQIELIKALSTLDNNDKQTYNQ